MTYASEIEWNQIQAAPVVASRLGVLDGYAACGDGSAVGVLAPLPTP